MGDKITRPASAGDVSRARALRKSLELGRAGLTQVGGPPQSTESATLRLDDPEVQKAYLEQLIESAPEAISILDRQHHIMRINGEFTRMFGFQPEETLGQRIDTLIVPPDRHAETRWLGEMLNRGEKVTLETKRQRKDGALIDVLISGSSVSVHGKRSASCVLYRDISSQKRAEALSAALYRIAEIASSTTTLQNFYRSIHGIVGELMYARNFYIAIYDPATQTISFPYFADEAEAAPACRKFGHGLTEYVLRSGEPLLCTAESFEELVQQKEVELIGAPSLDWLGVPLKNASHTFGVVVVQSYHAHTRFTAKDKEVLSFVSQQLAAGIEHKRHEEALRRSETRYRSLVLSAVYGIYRSTLEGRFLDVNPALVSMLGYDSAEEVLALAAAHSVFVDSEEQARVLREFSQGDRLTNVEVRWKRKDGSLITVRLSGILVERPEEGERVLEIIAEDVTERRTLEEQFRQAQKMEAVGRLAGGVAHDFNNLLMVIGGYTEVLLENIDRRHALYPKIEAIQQASDRATTLTKQLLAFSRKQLLELKVVDINVIVADMERLLRLLIGEDIELVTRLASNLGRTRADAGQVEQVLMNLVVNAKDAMPEGGRITIQTANVYLDSRREFTYMQPGQYVQLSVTDTGQGMDKETQSRIFEPFFTTKEKGKGTGLGLSTVYGIIKQSGGYVIAQSEPGHGTAFRIYLPRVEEEPESMNAVSYARPSDGGCETVLLVEDEESVRQLVRETLEAKGYRVLEAENGESALKIAAAHSGNIEMLITDVVMPGISGREVARQLCASYPATRVLYLSGYAEDAIAHHGVLEPGTEFLQKPFTLHMLSRKVWEVLHTKPQA